MKAVLCFYIWWILFLPVSSDSSADDTSAEMNQSRDLKWALIGGGVVGIAIGVSVFTCIYKKSRQTRHQDIESNGDPPQSFLTTRSPAERENRQTETTSKSDGNSERQDNKLLRDTLNAVKHELENQKDQLHHKLRDVETKRKKNKEELQMVEKKITEKEKYEDKDLLLKEKEKLLQSQWKLDEEKKLYERQILNIVKVMEPIEMYMMRTMEKNKDV